MGFTFYGGKRKGAGRKRRHSCPSSVLTVKEGLELVRNFAKKMKVTIRIEKGEIWKGS